MQIYQTLPVEQITEDFLWERLVPLLVYLDAESVGKVREALAFAQGVHAGQMRKSGEPYITHPVEVRQYFTPFLSQPSHCNVRAGQSSKFQICTHRWLEHGCYSQSVRGTVEESTHISHLAI